MKEKLSAAGLGLLVAAIVAVSATFAWVTLSRAPELSGVATTLSANGALEIALSNDDGTQPDEFDIDESVGLRVDVVSSNLQWGNLVNLSDPSYGLENFTLRPAKLNTTSLIDSPLSGAIYGQDGRIIELNTDSAYTKYDNKQFVVTDKFGVRAISSYKEQLSDSTIEEFKSLKQAVTNARTAVSADYADVVASFAKMERMISRYAQDMVNKTTIKGMSVSDGTGTDSNMGQYMVDLAAVYGKFAKAMDAQADAYVALANLQLYQWAKANQAKYEPTSWEVLCQVEEQSPGIFNYTRGTNGEEDGASRHGKISLYGFSDFVKDWKQLKLDLEHIEKYATAFSTNGTAIYWSHDGDSSYQLSDIVNRLIDFTNTLYIDIDGKQIKVSHIGGTEAMALLGADGETKDVYIVKGILPRFEKCAIDENDRMASTRQAKCTISVRAKVGITKSVTIYGVAVTTVTDTADMAYDTKKAVGKKDVASDAVAEDTYAMAVDFWVRTNAEQTFLTLEGAKVVDAETNTIMGYDGVNRIWGATGDSVLTTDSTTQGGGSCYVYYADTPEDQSRSLRLLRSMKVVFVSQSGKLLATADMDTEHYWAQNGRVTVPLVLSENTQTTYDYTNEEGQTVTGRAITEMVMDVAQRITAIIYLDGSYLSNTDVLSVADIEGQVNIQFGSSVNLETVGSNDLIDDVRSVTAIADPTSIDFDAAVTPGQKTTNVTLTVQGAEPDSITARFIRAINATQGSREDEMRFTKSKESGTWSSSYEFKAPGTYYLRHVQLDGVDYALSDPIKVDVTGFALRDVTWDKPKNSVVVRTSDSTYTATVYVEYASSDASKLPLTVKASFIREGVGDTVTVPLTSKGNGKWEGTGTFNRSGVYSMDYLIYTVDGVDKPRYQALNESFKKNLDLALGLYVVVKNNGGPLNEEYVAGKTYDRPVTVEVLDNSRTPLEELEGMQLKYSLGNSTVQTYDTDLQWDHTGRYYTGTLPLPGAGRYQFDCVVMKGGQTLTRAEESPVYIIVSPDPPIFDTSSQASYYGQTQFVPLTNDAVLDGIKIKNADSAAVSAVVYNENDDYREVEAVLGSKGWTVKLPTYSTGPDDAKVQTQDGEWSLVALKLSNCYDEKSVFRTGDDPIIWAGSDEISKTYAAENLTDDSGEVKVEEWQDFSKLSTKVSCSVKVTMNPGETVLGDQNTEFMHQFPVAQLGMSVKITDNDGNVIPSSKIEGVELTVRYDPSTSAKYGYEVSNDAANTYGIKLDRVDAEHGMRTVSSGDIWQYVGEYSVQQLTIKLAGGKTVTYAPDEARVPDKYTVTTKAPANEDIYIGESSITQLKKEFGRNPITKEVTGVFLETCDLGDTTVKVSLKPDVHGNQYAVMKDVSATLNLTYQNKQSAPYGGYHWSGTSKYEKIQMNMTEGVNGLFTGGSTPLLAGTYSAAIEVKVGKNITTKNLSDISAYSKAPDVTMARADSTPEIVTVNADAGTEASTNTFTGTNTVVNDGHAAVLFAAYRTSTAEENPGTYTYTDWLGSTDYNEGGKHAGEYARYTMPFLQFTLTNIDKSTCKDFKLSVPGNNGAEVSLPVNGNASEKMQIGWTKSGPDAKQAGTYTNGWGSVKDCEYVYTTQVPVVIGTQEVRTLTAQVEDTAYTVDLQTPLSIVQENRTLPSLVFEVGDSRFKTPDTEQSEDGRALSCTLPMNLYTVDGNATAKKETVAKEPVVIVDEAAGTPDRDITAINAKSDDWSWTTDTKKPVTVSKLYTETTATKHDSHIVKRIFSGTFYWKVWTGQRYLQTDSTQYAETRINVSGRTVTTSTVETVNRTTSLDYWLVDGVRYDPGETVTITGNSFAKAVFKTEEELVRKEVTTTTTDGTTINTYRAECAAVEVKAEGTTGEWVGTQYCDHYDWLRDCKKARGNEATARAQNPVIPTEFEGYEKRSNVTTGIKRDFSSTEWELDSSVKGADASSKTNVKIYDGSGKLIEENNY